MKQIILFVISIVFFSCSGQVNKSEANLLSISPLINQEDVLHKNIIESLNAFLKSKNASQNENAHWLNSDFEKYVYPFHDLYFIEKSKYGNDFYKPTLMEILPTESPVKKILKIAFIGHHPITNENQIKAIYNLVAQQIDGKIMFSKYLDYACRNWTIIKKTNLIYKLSPHRKVDTVQIDQQLEDIKKINHFFNAEGMPITYYSCKDAKEVFEIKGFDYNSMMYADTVGGFADYGNIIFSGKNAEIYTHEIVHLYTLRLYPAIDKYIDEGIATYLGGSGNHDYSWHRHRLKTYIDSNPEFKIAEHTDPYERLYIENETPIPYLSAALICERILRRYGKEKLITWLHSEGDLWAKLNEVGLNKQNIDLELKKELSQPVFLPW